MQTGVRNTLSERDPTTSMLFGVFVCIQHGIKRVLRVTKPHNALE